MGIKNKFFLLLVTASTVILCFSYTFIYHLFYDAMSKNLINQQQTEIQLNARIINNFTSFARQNIMMLAGDPYMGQSLSTYSYNTMANLRARELIQTQFSHYTNAQAPDSYPCHSTLFLNRESVPISVSFETATLDTIPYHQSSNIFTDLLVSNEEWYQNTIRSPRNFYAFVNENTDEFCIAQKFQNAYFTGNYHPGGQGVLVISVGMEHIPSTFDFTPVTVNSGYALFNDRGDMLYSSLGDMPVTEAADSLVTEIRGQKYLINSETVNYQLSLLFMTPYSDITYIIQSVMNAYFLSAAAILVFMALSCYLLSYRITKPIIYMSQVIGGIEDTRLFNPDSFSSIHDKELKILCQSFGNLTVKVNGLIENIQIQGENEKKAELKALQAQINPHFIFNAMDVVNWIALSRDDDDIANIVNSIASLMRYSITEADSLVDISLEIENIHEFISIYQLRHECRIILNSDDIRTKLVQIPKFTIQPLVENSIQHGIIDENTPIEIRIRAWQEDDCTVIEVSDDGRGGDPERLNDYLAYRCEDLEVSNGFGIRNVDQRIKLNFKGRSGLYYGKSADGRLTARIVLERGSAPTE